MIALARMVFDLVLPSEQAGDLTLTGLNQDEILVRKLFEKAVGNFYAAELDRMSGWKVRQGRWLAWPQVAPSAGINSVLPNMKTDIILENESAQRRIIIDTKFASIFARSQYREAVLKSGYLYQMYAYLRSQESDDDPLSVITEGILLHPAIDADVDEEVTMQGHRFRFVTINLVDSSDVIIARLRTLPFKKVSQ